VIFAGYSSERFIHFYNRWADIGSLWGLVECIGPSRDGVFYLAKLYCDHFPASHPICPVFLSLQLSFLALTLVFLASLIDGLADFFYFSAFEINDAVTASIFLSLSPMFTLLLLPLVDIGQSAFSVTNGFGVLAIVAGLILLNSELQRETESSADMRKIGLCGYRFWPHFCLAPMYI